MRNLRNIGYSVSKFDVGNLTLTASTWDTTNDALICAFGPSETNAFIELLRVDFKGKPEGVQSNIAAWDAPCPHPELECDKILCLQYFAETSTVCLVLAGGDIVVVREEPLPGQDLVEIVGSVDVGIRAAAWSPDEELLAICTQAGTFLSMSRDFEGIADIKFSPDDIKASNHVSVGWGKKETQFQGKRAKALRDPTVPEHVDEGLPSEYDDSDVSISWRGDGAFVAVNSIENGKRRMIRVYSREGVLDSVSEPVDYLEGTLSWRPAGNLIAGIQRLEEQIKVVFFERNGLRHGEFSLRQSPKDATDWRGPITLKWNSDSSVLAVCFRGGVQLWTMGNYHYYLKQEIRRTGDQTVRPVQVQWHPERPLKLVIEESKCTHNLEYAFNVVDSTILPPNDHGTVVVIDGNTAKLTPLRFANIPPPMSLHEAVAELPIIDAAINSSARTLVLLHRDGLGVYDYDPEAKPILPPRLSMIFKPWSDPVAVPLQVVVGPDDSIFILFYDPNERSNSLYRIEGDERQKFALPPEYGSIMQITVDVTHQLTFVQSGAGHVLRVAAGGPEEYSTLTRLPRLCPWIEIVLSDEQSIVFGLANNGCLYANERLLVRNCTSFAATSDYLIFTTTQHLLKFVHMASVDELEVPSDAPETDERCRSIERGARIVTVIPSAFSLVLQMPRGNLETIFPRALVLAAIRQSIDKLDYKTAFLACRSQRVDMNIIHDHDAAKFMSHIPEFVSQVKKKEHIDLFLSQLRGEDVSQTIYKDTAKRKRNGILAAADNTEDSQAVSNVGSESKVNRICNAFLSVFEKLGIKHLQNIITANVCKDPPDLEGGLSVVSKLEEKSPDLAEKAAEHICFLADVNKLYEHSLGMYDLELTLLIAQQSQKDPREYLPYMQSLQEMPDLRRKFTIDNDLGRRSKALAHIYELDVFDEFKAFTQKHALYTPALDLYKYQPDRLNSLTRLYADYLNGESRAKEAGLAFEFLSDYESACTAYATAGCWREALSSALLADLPVSNLIELAHNLADTLTEAKDYHAAGEIYRDHLSDVDTAAKMFCKGSHFSDAIRLVALAGRKELLTEIVDPGLVEASASTTELLAEMKGQLQAQIPRLRDLRRKKAEDPLAFFEGVTGGGGGGDIPDDISLAPSALSTSGGTFMTRYTNRSSGSGTMNTATTRKTSKNRRREERKRARGKKGSVYEEEYLVGSFARLIERVDGMREEVGRLREGLFRRGMRERAGAVERAMLEVVGICRDAVGEVFEVVKGEGVVDGEGGMENEMGERPAGADGVFWDSREERNKRVVPVVKEFERLSLV
ncbi:putative killer toxin sensitivity protein [Aulographum hederae CBS 113979]|uniref:Elongator complex protein 1 n=1 Tax=Aulographum hederae CBS 113979 TaxID=1176131 RepID=A0A6G1HDA5_9PEZI|nr:putative killer toxin sensitivity protein [Aulographum hederae CBS 113979]